MRSSESYPAPAAAGIVHYQWLDLLRFIAALTVVGAHVRGFTFVAFDDLDPTSQGLATVIFFALTRLGHEAVIVFFVLSGFLVGGKAIRRIADGTFDPEGYLVDRTSRIWLPLIPALVLSALADGVNDGVVVWIGNILGLQGVLVAPLGGNGPLWSLAYEVWFYALTYAVGRQATRRSLDVLAIIIFSLVALVFTKLGVQYLACWLIGAAFFNRPHRLHPVSAVMAATVLGSIAVCGIQISSAGIVHLGYPGLQPMFELLLAVAAGVLAVTLSSIAPTRLSAIAVPLAAFSYTLYLTHYPVLIAWRLSGWERLHTLDPWAFGYAGLASVACFAVAYLMYWFFERHTKRVRDWIKSTRIVYKGKVISREAEKVADR